MTYKVKVISERKGGNPGGEVVIDYSGRETRGYLKYVNGSQLSPSISLLACNQPIYEAMTYEMAKMIGLLVPDYFVLNNNQEDLEFEYADSSIKKLRETTPFYFVSIFEPRSMLTEVEKEELGELVENAMMPDMQGIDFLLLWDIIGKGQNWNYLVDLDRISYHDLGCSFVHAKEGFLSTPSGRRREYYSELSRKEKKSLYKRLDEASFNNCYGEKFSIEEFILSIPNLMINFQNLQSRVCVSNVISKKEILQIEDIYLHSVPDFLKGIK